MWTVSLRPPRLRPRTIAIALSFLLILVATALAQTGDTAVPLRKTYGIRDGEFLIVAEGTKWTKNGTDPATLNAGQIWQFLHGLGIPAYSFGSTINQLTAIYNSPSRRHDTDRILFHGPELIAAGEADEVIFYPFTQVDTVQSPYLPCKFAYRAGGQGAFNTNILNNGAREQVYSDTNTTANQLVAANIAYKWKPTDTLRMQQNATEFMDEHRQREHINPDTVWVAVTGHLFLGGSAQTTDSLLKIDVWYEIDKDRHFQNNLGHLDTAKADTETLIKTLWVKKSDLMPIDSSGSFDQYQEISLPVGLTICADSTSGPSTTIPLPNYYSERFDIRVHWTGKEKLALRSVAVRDRGAEQMLGRTQRSIDFRASLMAAAKQTMLASSTATLSATNLRRDIIRLFVNNEPLPMESDVSAAIDQMIRDTFNLRLYRPAHGQTLQPGDSIKAYTWELANPTFHSLTDFSEIGTFQYLDDPRDTTHVDTNYAAELHGTRVKNQTEIPYHQLPTIKQHNGGRGHLPLMFDADPAALVSISRDTLRKRIEEYEEVMQRGFISRYRPGITENDVFASLRIEALGASAEVSRTTGGRHIPLIGTDYSLYLRPLVTGYVPVAGHPDSAVVSGLDTLFSHIPEPAEMRMGVSLALAYGAQGIFWWPLNTQYEPIAPSQAAPAWYSNGGCCYGSNGFYTSDTTQRDSSIVFSDTTNTVHDTIPHFYLGWPERTAEIRYLNNKWLPKIGPQMVKLHWRTSYSIHYCVRNPHLLIDTNFRPLPGSEIVTAVTARDLWTGKLDSAHKTYVELGLFDTRHDTSAIHNRMNDTNYLFVANRRCYEPDRDNVTNILDTLAESRIISLRLHIDHPDTTGYNYVRVTEIEPDTLRLPLMTHARQRLDTIVNGDSAVAVALRPGGGTLLRITYAPPELALNGDTRFNGQKKILFDGRRYHAVYARYNGTEYGSFADTIFYRRSLPVTDTMGSIAWEPVEMAVSVGGALGDTTRYQNRFPSMTLRINPMDTTVTIVWDCHPADPLAPSGQREIVMRDIRRGNHWVGRTLTPFIINSQIRHVDWHKGLDPVVWGTPVICRANAADILAWSDSTLGIVARTRIPLDSAKISSWPVVPAIFSARLLVSQGFTTTYGVAGNRPSVPPFAHVASHDSSCAIVFQQPVTPPNSAIVYQRVWQDSTVPTGLRLKVLAPSVILGGPGLLGNPSVDQTQDALGRRQDGVAWESIEAYFSNGIGLNFASVATTGATSNLVPWPALVQAQVSPGLWTWPSTSSLNRVFTMADTSQEPLFAVAFHSNDQYYPMGQALVSYQSASFKASWPKSYAYGGWYPNTCGAPIKQSTHQAAIYRIYDGATDPNGTIHTTRQFFAKSRPGGYMADGRSVQFRISDSLAAGFFAGMHDTWIATATGSRAVSMIPRDVTQQRTDSMNQVAALLRTECFTAADSITFGITLFGRLYGADSVVASNRLDCIAELIDSATGSVAAQLDSFSLSTTLDSQVVHLQQDLDLLSGTYYVRLRFASPAMPSDSSGSAPRYPVTEIASYAENAGLGKSTRTSVTGASARISAQPNPTADGTQIRFSVPIAEYVTIRVVDANGHEVLRPVNHQWIDAGRFAVDVEGSSLGTGSYIVELNAGDEHAVVKLSVVR